MKIVRIPILPKSRFHFGEFKVDLNVGLSSTSVLAHSDTLFSSIINSYSLIDDAEGLVEGFTNSEIKISSLFYYLKKGTQIIYFMPKPVFLETESKIDGNHKLRNKIKFVSLKIWENGFNQDKWHEKSDYVILQNEFLILKEEFDSIFPGYDAENIKIFNVAQHPKSPSPQIQERKNNSKDAIFYITVLEFVDNHIEDLESGFYFFYSSTDKYIIHLKDAVNLMSKSGIGGEKNNMSRILGYPLFEELSLNIQSLNYTNISIVSPADLSDFNNILHYKTFIRGGRKINSGGGYKVIRMIKEGALVLNNLKGKMVTIGKDDNNNDALRNGMAFLVPVNIS